MFDVCESNLPCPGLNAIGGGRGIGARPEGSGGKFGGAGGAGIEKLLPGGGGGGGPKKKLIND